MNVFLWTRLTYTRLQIMEQGRFLDRAVLYFWGDNLRALPVHSFFWAMKSDSAPPRGVAWDPGWS